MFWDEIMCLKTTSFQENKEVTGGGHNCRKFSGKAVRG